ncbi:MAG TPA: hypothetical protein VI168_12230 [Croceibacterium sp.]
MIARLRSVLLLPLLGSLSLAAPVEAKTWKQVYPLQKQRTFTIEGDGVSVTVTPPPPYPDDEEVSDEEFQATYEDAAITVTFPGLPPYAVPTDRYRSSPYGISVGIGFMARGDETPTVLIGGYSGGAHCCATLQAVSLVDGRPVSAILPMKDGEPVDRFPRDVDRDGTVDIEWTDDSLRYAFSSGAASWSLPRIYNLRHGLPVDVSRDPGFARIYRKFARDTLKECRSDEGERNGACAAYAYVRAIQGDSEDGIRTAVGLATDSDWYPYDCTVDYVDDMCPQGKERQFAGFEDALRWIMRKNGYLPAE